MNDVTIKITKSHIDKINDLLSYGLPTGLGEPEPGKMCVEAVICHALGLPHSDDPLCVAQPIRKLKICLNDSPRWTSNQSRAKGLQRLALAQLGSLGIIDEVEFVRRVAHMTIQTVVPAALRAAARMLTGKHPTTLVALAVKCAAEPTEQNAREAQKAATNAATNAANTAYAKAAANAAANAATNAADVAYAAANATYAAVYAAYVAYAAVYAAYANAAANDTANDADKLLADYAEAVVQILIDMKAPGCQWLGEMT